MYAHVQLQRRAHVCKLRCCLVRYGWHWRKALCLDLLSIASHNSPRFTGQTRIIVPIRSHACQGCGVPTPTKTPAGLSEGTKVGLGVGLGIGLPATAAVVYLAKRKSHVPRARSSSVQDHFLSASNRDLDNHYSEL